MVGTTMMAIAFSSGTAKLINPIAIGGMPMPIAPLAMPATTNATAITAICRSDIQGISGEEGVYEAVELGPEASADIIGLHHDLVHGAVEGDESAVLHPH